ncbi:peptidoglycan DD-metalloendopeptidase family protein [Chitinophaga sp. GCM10012297]|uniref:Peptidoglycan DD-metalloendopeptidase family protein n=1 Tax=Chitinophaga chungangae TaxID=2821488 RepID=A0ABS3YC46_9BACT|nr:peptidoglycan DD-metalloendopeptidase family protein [Chitinophaga chungangae]MBO9152035.1 peptidoglycan DD-metalloendopeptidase family protein [Chitinophaga chungangae]
MINLRYLAPFSLAALLFCAACSTAKRGLFVKRTPHEQYASSLTSGGLKETALGSAWFAAADKALARPLSITLPYRETGYFPAEKPAAAGYAFAVRRGEKIVVRVSVQPPGNILLFTELWQPAENNTSSFIASADTLTRVLEHEVTRDGRLVLRLQPELLKGAEYTVSVTTAASLAFPVSGGTASKIGSFWGDSRDHGARSHEGVDIFGKFRTPVVAAADGFVTRAGENNLGGKVVFMQPEQKDYTLYYAHLDEQLVSAGQRVSTGDTLGLMGNTGNARNTPTHLHFGIYTSGGAVDPLPFIRSFKSEAPAVTASLDLLNDMARTATAASLRETPEKNGAVAVKLPANHVLRVRAVYRGWYRVELPDQREGFIESSAVTGKSYRNRKAKDTLRLLDMPSTVAGVKTLVPEGGNITVLGTFNGFQLVKAGENEGWVEE